MHGAEQNAGQAQDHADQPRTCNGDLKKPAFHGVTSSPISASPDNRELLGRAQKKGQSPQSTDRRVLFQPVRIRKARNF
jgi:hypothetical protein